MPQNPAPAVAHGHRHIWLSRSAKFCFLAIAAGQAAFTLFIAAYYYVRTFSGNLAGWNDKPIITGFVAGDTMGNIMFAVHVLFAAIITLGGLVQLLPVIRARWPQIHRANGRLFIFTALLLAIGGLWMTWVRGSYLTLTGAIGISLNAALIIGFAVLAWRAARARDFAAHRRWALRLFVVASAVWFMRVGYMAWGLATGGLGVGDALNGPFDMFIAFANSLLPLAVLEVYLAAGNARSSHMANAAAVLLALCAVAIIGGSIGAWLVMWGPYV